MCILLPNSAFLQWSVQMRHLTSFRKWQAAGQRLCSTGRGGVQYYVNEGGCCFPHGSHPPTIPPFDRGTICCHKQRVGDSVGHASLSREIVWCNSYQDCMNSTSRWLTVQQSMYSGFTLVHVYASPWNRPRSKIKWPQNTYPELCMCLQVSSLLCSPHPS